MSTKRKKIESLSDKSWYIKEAQDSNGRLSHTSIMDWEFFLLWGLVLSWSKPGLGKLCV